MLEGVEFPGAASVYREYEVQLAAADNASIAFTLADPAIDLKGAAIARELGGFAFGLVSLSGYPDGPPDPLLWLQTSSKFGIVTSREDDELGDDVKRVICLYARAFFKDIAAVEPTAAALHERGWAGPLH
jgi:hypothetical protein